MRINESDLKQGSPEWHAFRSGGIGGSEIATVIGVNPYETAYKLWQYKTGLKEAPDISENYAVKRGQTLEPKARELVNAQLNKNFVPCIFQSDTVNYMKYSSDGYDEETNELLEIKCLGDKNHTIVCETNQPLDYYMPQLQWALMITGATCIYFVSYCPTFPQPLKIIQVAHDLPMQDMLKIESAKFWQMVETKTPPELTDKDFLDVSCEEFGKLADQYRQANAEIKLAESKLEKLKAEIKKFSAGRNIIGNGLKVFTSLRKGNVDYSKIEQLKEIDLEKYRKAPSEVLYIKID